MSVNFIYITAGNIDEARSIGKALVRERLVACVNIIDNVNSMFWWEGTVRDEKEVIIIAKTREELVPELIARVKSLHSYEVPCVVSLPILDGYKPFLDWVRNETGKDD